MKNLLDLKVRQISEAVWKATLIFFAIPTIAWFVFWEHSYEWYNYVLCTVLIFFMTWTSFLFNFIVIVLLINDDN
jgi:hypothetical protein